MARNEERMGNLGEYRSMVDVSRDCPRGEVPLLMMEKVGRIVWWRYITPQHFSGTCEGAQGCDPCDFCSARRMI